MKCFYDRKHYPEYEVLKQYRKSLLANNEIIEVSDFGSGSKIFKSNRRKISKIAATAGISESNTKLLFRVANYLKPQQILEIGTSLGLASAALSLGSRNAKITTLEGCEQTFEVAKRQLLEFGLNNIEPVCTKFDDYLVSIEEGISFDLIYFDGNHTKAATLSYFDKLLPTIKNETVWIFDDIHWSAEMQDAWKMIKQHPKVNVTIDTFQWGLVFFRMEQEKEDFTIRI
jgi:predicted O-methyltransferase YrrM